MREMYGREKETREILIEKNHEIDFMRDEKLNMERDLYSKVDSYQNAVKDLEDKHSESIYKTQYQDDEIKRFQKEKKNNQQEIERLRQNMELYTKTNEQVLVLLFSFFD